MSIQREHLVSNSTDVVGHQWRLERRDAVGNDRTLAWRAPVSIIRFAEWNPLVVPRSRRHPHHEVANPGGAYPNLDPGETAALLLAEQLDAIVLTDDLDAREAATGQGLEVHGSIGVILYAFSCEELTSREAKSVLRSFETEATLYLSQSLLEHAIRLVESGDAGW